MAKYSASPETRAAHQDVLWHFGYEHFEYAEAEVWARLIIERFPGTWAAADAQLDLAEIIVQVSHDFDAAWPLIDDTLAWAHDHGDWSLAAAGLHVRGRLLNKEREYDGARDVLKQTLALIDDHPEGEWLRVQTEAEYAATYLDQGDYFKALGKDADARASYMTAQQEYADAVERHTDDGGDWVPYMKFQRAKSLLKAGDEANALACFLQLVKDHPTDPWTWVAFSYMELGLQRPERPASVVVRGEEQ